MRLDGDRTDTAAYTAQLPGKDFILFVGDLSRDKGIHTLLNAYGELKNAPPLVLIGRRCQDTPAEFPPNVVCLNSWPHAAVMEAWRRCSIAVAPSAWPEPFGVVVLEAMAAGRPVIASRIGGLPDMVVDGETGVLVPPDDPTTLRTALERLLADRALREQLGQAGQRRVEQFRASAVIPHIEQVYRMVMLKETSTEPATGGLVMDNDLQLPKNYPRPQTAPAPSSAEGMAAKSLRATDTARVYGWGWLPALSLTSAIGLLLVAVANTLSRSAAGQYELLFWVGLLLMVVPMAARLASSEPARQERIGLIIVLGLGLYLAKILHSPYSFTFSDELIHSYNGTMILETGRLFNANSILPVTPLYPGLETITAGLASLSGLSIYGAGLMVVGVARLIAMLALFLFYEEVSGSSRLAGIAALLYVMNANFLFWSAQFSYESLALPLAMMVLYVVIRRTATPRGVHHRGLTLVALLGITAVVITHHLTAYFLVAFFGVWTLGALFLRFRAVRATSSSSARGSSNQHEANTLTGVRAFNEPAGLLLFSTIATLVWLVGVANITIGYLSPVLSRAAASMFQIAAGDESTRELFQSASGYVAPLWERLVGLGSVVVMLLALPFGLRKIWQNFRGNVIALMLTGAALAYFAVLGLRLSPAAWETANRASAFLFIGLAFVLAFAVQELWDRLRAPWLSRAIALGGIALIFMGGIIAGWTPTLRLSLPLRVNVENVVIEPQGFTAARWVRAALGPGNQVATDESNARLMLAYGGQLALAGRYPDIKDLLGTFDFPDWQVELLREWAIRYVAVDRRLISANNMAGYYFDRTPTGSIPSTDLFDPKAYGKFDKPQGISRLFDSGNIVIYDVGVMSHATTVK